MPGLTVLHTVKHNGKIVILRIQLPGLYLLPDIPQGPDAVEKGIFLMGDIGQFVFLIDYCFISFLQTGEGPPLGTAPPVCFCLRF